MSVTLGELPDWERLLVVVAHPDDESFGLGALLAEFVARDTQVRVLCLTRGEASTLGAEALDLATARATELAAAAERLGLASVRLLDFADGNLAAADPTTVSRILADEIGELRPTGVLVFEAGGVTGHPDHRAATDFALTAAATANLPVLAWTLPADLAEQLRAETGVPFTSHLGQVQAVAVTRERQLAAIAEHRSQAVPGSVLWRRLELSGDREFVAWLRPPGSVS
jgi:LmbE family N-acetylglucosaminyl deacetylase